MSDNRPTETHVLYNARCPVCRAEIDHYRSYAEARGLPLVFHDLGTRDLASWGIDEDAAARRLHVRQGGRVLSGVDAFLALWRAMPRYRWLARIVALPGLRLLAHQVYERVLAPRLYARHVARMHRLRPDHTA
ncbi:putative DCC family thiol-disulfide oxidoreductase YuxK [Roseovarius sp. MBR-78]|jgi:predicted DCC family thiol-disulfide oxidoreductase YuxK|uniref:thiol-disulfide oxidoreductase DCC family protein n=1 Tax=Roseovarius sp. MBR-78 TaxID=3156460 RepID=UPI003393485A